VTICMFEYSASHELIKCSSHTQAAQVVRCVEL
jgi:hypothetical protein